MSTINNFQVGDKIEHNLMPGFVMEVLEIDECEVDSVRSEQHFSYRIIDPDGQNDWLCGYDVRAAQ